MRLPENSISSRSGNTYTIQRFSKRDTIQCAFHTAFKKDVPPGSKVDHFDRGRAELYINMFCPYELSDADVLQFVGAMFDASRGDPDVKALLLDAPFDWLPDAAAVALSAKFETLWDEFQITLRSSMGCAHFGRCVCSQLHALARNHGRGLVR